MSRSLTLPLTAALVFVVTLPGAASLQFASATNLVVLNVRVTDKRGEHVANLPRHAFTVREDGQPQVVSLFLNEDAPASVGLIVDSSTSMWAIRDTLLAGALAFARASHRDDELFAIAFNEQRRPALPPSAPFTGDPVVLGDALATVVQPRGRTALFDAIRSGLLYANRGTHPRKALVVVSDGGDNASTATFEEIVAETQASNVVMYGLALIDPTDSSANPDVLRRLSRASGGETFTPRGVADLTSAMEHIAADIRQAYVIAYTAAGSRPGAYHALKVEFASREHRNLRVRAREGYREPPPAPPEIAPSEPQEER